MVVATLSGQWRSTFSPRRIQSIGQHLLALASAGLLSQSHPLQQGQHLSTGALAMLDEVINDQTDAPTAMRALIAR